MTDRCLKCNGRGYIQWHPYWDNGNDPCDHCRPSKLAALTPTAVDASQAADPVVNAPDLLPCPFCGELPEITERGETIALFVCSNPPCKGSGLFVGFSREDRDKAIAAWNTRAPLAEALAVPKWKPIETAPKDGTLILLYLGDGLMACRRWQDNHWRGWDAEDATHWMPLPEPPAALRAIGDRSDG